MLKSFTVKNFLSIKDEVNLSMETGAYLKKYSNTNVSEVSGQKLLKNAIIFGPNGSGKTNIIYAIKTMRRLVLTNTKTVTDSLPYLPFSFSDLSNDTKFEVDFIYNNIEYNYYFTYNSSEFSTESLSYKNNGHKEVIYYYDREKNILDIDDSLEINVNNVRKNQLYIFTLQSNNEEHSSNVFRWFKDSLIIDDFNEVSDLVDSSLIQNILKDDNKLRLLEYLKYADSNIIDVEVVKIKRPQEESYSKIVKVLEIFDDNFNKTDFDINTIIPEYTYNLLTVYNKFDISGKIIGKEKLTLNSESSGTEKLIKIALVMLNIGNDYKTIIIDELDQSLHYNIMSAIVNLFNSKQNNNQLIFTTHNIMMIDENLRTDQIYFVEKDYKGQSDLYSLFDFNESSSLPRGDIKYLKRYVDGQFGAIPNVDAKKMICVLNREEDSFNG